MIETYKQCYLITDIISLISIIMNNQRPLVADYSSVVKTKKAFLTARNNFF